MLLPILGNQRLWIWGALWWYCGPGTSVFIATDYGLDGPGTSVFIATDYGLDGPGPNSVGDEIFRPSGPTLGPTQPPVPWVPDLSRG